MIDLCIDIGNTDICAGVFQETELLDHTRCSSNIDASQFFEGGPTYQYDRAIIASVVPDVTQNWIAEIKARYGIDAILCSAKLVGDLLNMNVDDPNSVGADRIADGVAAKHIYGNNCIVVDFGTATNIEYIDENGVFQGGIFAPGIWSGMKGLENAAAKLPNVRIEVPQCLLGKNTVDAIQSGIIYGEACRVDGLVFRLIEKFGNKGQIEVIATGGFSPIMYDICRCFTVHDNLLTLKGLEIIIDTHF